ncbi:MAG: hypothetical protein Q7S75_00025 [bacterium]|nr:hypothetical protein [bacterium]
MREVSKAKARLDLDRPLPEQPIVSATFKNSVPANPQDWVFYIRGTQYYDGSAMKKLREDATKIRTSHFTKEFPAVKDPAPDMKELGDFLKLLLANELRGRGLKVSEHPCGECIDVDIDYAYRIDPTFVGAEEVLNLRPNMSYGGVLFAQGRDEGKLPRNLGVGAEKNRWALKPKKEKERVLAPALRPLADELLYVLKKVLGKDTSK